MKSNLRKSCRISLVILVGLVLTVVTSVAEDRGLKEAVQNDQIIGKGNVGILTYQQKKYLVSVGVSQIEGNSPQARLKARREARQKAEKGLLTFIYDIKVSSKEELKTKSVFSRNRNNSVVESDEKIITDEFTETIKEEGDGVISNTIDIGRWKSEDNKEYLYALGIMLK